jgi:peptidoglycan/LPS O-acetylase OafA/YrhL
LTAFEQSRWPPLVGYHLGTPWLPGGLLGVGVFFTLSGYLITTI